MIDIVPQISGLSWCPVQSLLSTQSVGNQSRLRQTLLAPPHGLLRSIDIGAFDTQVLQPAVGVLGVVQADGALLAAQDLPIVGGSGKANCGGDQVDSTVSSIALSKDSFWLSAIEPFVGGAFDAMAISSDGTRLVATAGTSLTGNLLVAGQGGALDKSAPPPRSNEVAIYSRMAGGVFVGGGASVTGKLSSLHDIWFRAPGPGRWTDVTPHGKPASDNCDDDCAIADLGIIQAITYSFRDQKLWILDDLGNGSLRLSRADLGGLVEPLARWRQHDYDRSFLSLDRDGTALVSLAHSDGPGFLTARVELRRFKNEHEGHGKGEREADVHVTAVYRNKTARLDESPFVSPRSYGFIIEEGGRLKVLRVDSLSRLEDDSDLDEEF